MNEICEKCIWNKQCKNEHDDFCDFYEYESIEIDEKEYIPNWEIFYIEWNEYIEYGGE